MIIRLLLILMIIFSPLARGSVSPLAFGPLQIVTALALLLWFLRMFKEGAIKIKRTELDMPILIFALLAIASIFRSPYKYDSIIELFKLLNLIAIFYLVVNNVKERGQISKIVNIIVILGGALSLFGIIQYLGGTANPWWSNKRFLSSVYVNHNHFAGFLELCIPLCLGLVLSEKTIEKKSFYTYIIILMLAAFMFSMSRGAWLSLSISMTAMFVMLYKRRLIRGGFFIALLLLTAIAFLIVKNVDMNLFLNRVASYKELDFSGRLEIWKAALNIVKERPLFGTGLGSFIYYFPKYRPLGFNLFANFAHNDYLQVASETGIFGLFCMIGIFLLIVKNGFANYLISQSSFKKGISLGAAIGILSIAIHSFGDFNLRIPANAVLFTVISGIIFNLRSRNQRPDTYFEFKLSKLSLGLVRPICSVAIFIWILCIARIVVAEAIYRGFGVSDFKDRIRTLNRALYVLPENNTYYKDLARLYINKASISLNKEKELLTALENYRRATEINPMDAWAWQGKGDTLLYLGRFEDAKDAYKKALGLDPNNSLYLKKIGEALVRAGDTDRAVNVFKRASFIEKNRFSKLTIENDTSKPERYIEKGDLFYSEGYLKNALDMYRIAEGLGAKEEDIKIRIINVLERMGQKDRAEQYAGSTPLALGDPNKILFLNSRARYLISKGEYIKADVLIEKALSLKADDSITLQNKIDLLRRERRPVEEVAPYIEKLLELNNDNTKVLISGKDIILTFDLERKQGLMVTSGMKEFSFIMPLGLIDIKILAAGSFANDEWPRMVVKMNSKPILSTHVSSRSYIEFNSSGFTQEGSNSLRIEFSNDYWDSVSGEDRNLEIKKIILEYKYPDYES